MAQRAMRLNHARETVAAIRSSAGCRRTNEERFRLSRRQAYRYLQQAAHLKQPLLVGDTKIAFTVNFRKPWFGAFALSRTAQICR